MRQKPDVTIFADASHDAKSRVAGWAAWIKADNRASILCGAAMKKTIASTIEAELCALANALALARLRGVLATGSVVMIQSDCAVALSIIRGKVEGVTDRPALGGIAVNPARRTKLSSEHLAAVNVIREIAETLEISIITRHVRGHQNGSGRQWVNSQVDRIARRAMRDRRQRISRNAALGPTSTSPI